MFLLIFSAFAFGTPSPVIHGQGTSYLPQFIRAKEVHHHRRNGAEMAQENECKCIGVMRFRELHDFQKQMYQSVARYEDVAGYWNSNTIIDLVPLYEDPQAKESQPSWALFIHKANRGPKWDAKPFVFYCYEYEPPLTWEWLNGILELEIAGPFEATCK